MVLDTQAGMIDLKGDKRFEEGGKKVTRKEGGDNLGADGLE